MRKREGVCVCVCVCVCEWGRRGAFLPKQFCQGEFSLLVGVVSFRPGGWCNFVCIFFYHPFIGPFDLSFPGDSDDGYAITDDVPDMMSFSVCFWLKLVYPAGSIKTMALLSYSNSKYDNAYILDTQGSSINIYMDDMAVL